MDRVELLQVLGRMAEVPSVLRPRDSRSGQLWLKGRTSGLVPL
jgi:hypothetical protein